MLIAAKGAHIITFLLIVITRATSYTIYTYNSVPMKIVFTNENLMTVISKIFIKSYIDKFEKLLDLARKEVASL